MNRIACVTDVHRGFRTILSKAAGDQVPCGLAHVNRSEVAVISHEEFIQFLTLKEPRASEEIDRVMGCLAQRNAVCGDDEVAADAEAALAEGLAASVQQWIEDHDTIS